eukprot:TRINITY_DN5884_c0_g1_i1.p1 TRINITY_DN5884_c0_g1~~TRINITY_DN5884_c0_g1_i1.p1  ORF type:complete len:106 (-),score=25.00 TRINITY_DN5884_c0_g1_i1:483-800(-)
MLLHISNSLTESVLGGLASVSGSGSFLKDNNSSFHCSSYSFLFQKKNRREALNHNDNLLRAAVLNEIDKGIATHVVTEITYGGSFILTIIVSNSSNNESRYRMRR